MSAQYGKWQTPEMDQLYPNLESELEGLVSRFIAKLREFSHFTVYELTSKPPTDRYSLVVSLLFTAPLPGGKFQICRVSAHGSNHLEDLRSKVTAALAEILSRQIFQNCIVEHFTFE